MRAFAWAARGVVALSLATISTGCMSSLHEVQAAGYAPSRQEGPPIQTVPIQSAASQSVVLGIVGNTDYVDEARTRLMAQCSGEIVGLNTRYSTQLGFLSYRNDVHMQALCVRN